MLYSLTAGARELLHLRTPALADLHLACAAASLACAKPASPSQPPASSVSAIHCYHSAVSKLPVSRQSLYGAAKFSDLQDSRHIFPVIEEPCVGYTVSACGLRQSQFSCDCQFMLMVLLILQQAGAFGSLSKAEGGPSLQMSALQQQQILSQLQQGSAEPKDVPKHRRTLQRLSQHPSGDLQRALSNASERIAEHSLKSQMGHAA